MKRFASCAAVAVCFSMALMGRAADPKVDPKDDAFGTPLKSAGAYLDAGVKMDVDTMLAHCVPGKEAEALVRWSVALSKAGKELREAAVTQYGKEGTTVWPLQKGSEILKDLTAKEKGDTAEIVIPNGPGKTNTMKLKKVADKWLVDAASIPHPPTEELRQSMLKGIADTLAEINAGSVTSIDALKMSLMGRLMPASTAMAPADQQAATQPAPNAPRVLSGEKAAPPAAARALAASDGDAIAKSEGKTAAVTGEIESVAWSKSGKVLNITFKGGGSFKVASFVRNKEALDKAFAGDVVKELTGKTICVTGLVKKYQGSEEVLVDDPKQIVVVPAKP